jgi:hypothetical protein
MEAFNAGVRGWVDFPLAFAFDFVRPGPGMMMLVKLLRHRSLEHRQLDPSKMLPVNNPNVPIYGNYHGLAL